MMLTDNLIVIFHLTSEIYMSSNVRMSSDVNCLLKIFFFVQRISHI